MSEAAQRSPAALPDAAALEIFQNQWEIYQKFLRHDYLFNAEACAALQRFVTDDLARPFAFLDLACGDASGIAATLKGTPVRSYRGVDLSAPALASARDNLAALSCSVALEEADFCTAVRERPADIVWISLSLHHLDTTAKLALMREVRTAIDDDGAFLVYEPTRRDGEDRQQYLERFEGIGRSQWKDLTANEFAEAMKHVRTSDLPETVSDWQRLGTDAGFTRIAQLYQSPDDLFRLFVYRP